MLGEKGWEYLTSMWRTTCRIHWATALRGILRPSPPFAAPRVMVLKRSNATRLFETTSLVHRFHTITEADTRDSNAPNQSSLGLGRFVEGE
jgi:hypothetical protein